MREQHLLGRQMGNYRLIRLLGRGGFAEVYLGEHLHLGTQAAIKVLLTDLSDENDIEHFRYEARMAAHLVHPHIVQVLEFGIEGRTPFLVMRYAPGGTLRQRHPRGSQVPLATVVGYVKQVASALQYAHDQHLIHRDVKPENMLIGSSQDILLSDFGVAMRTQSSRQHLQEVAGTATYMAPEQIQGHAHPASDQYALAVVVYEWLAGDRPFKGSFREVASQHLFQPPSSLCARLPDLPPSVEQTVLKALAKSPGHRFDSVWEFATALERAGTANLTNGLTLPAYEPQIPFPPDSITPDVASLSDSQSTIGPLSVSEGSRGIAEQSTRKLVPRRRTRRALLGLTLGGVAVLGAAGALALEPSVLKALFDTSITSVAGPTPTAMPQPSPTATPEPTATALPQGTVLTTYSGHRDIVEAGAWSPDSKRIASASKDRTVQVWDASNGNTLFTYSGHTDIADAVSWSPDGTRIVSASLDKTVRVWDAITGSHVLIYRGHTNKVAAAAWSPDGKYIASGGNDTTVQVWRAANGVRTFRFTGHQDKVWTLAWSPDSKRIASASADATVQVWDATTGGNLFVYKGHSGIVDAVAWSPDGTRIASCSYDNTVQVWNAADGAQPYVYRGHTSTVWWSTWSPDSQRIASASSDQTVQVWDAADGGHPYVYQGQNMKMYFVAWSPDGTRLLSGGNGPVVQVWVARQDK